MSHVITLDLPITASVVVDLRRQSQANPGVAAAPVFYKATQLKMKIFDPAGGTITAVVQPIVVADGATPPTDASSIAFPNAGTSNGTMQLDSAKNQEVTVGQQYSPGFTPQVFPAPLATHLLVLHTGAGPVGKLQIVVD